MNDPQSPPAGPDLTQGVPAATIADGAMVLGHARGDPVLLARRGAEFFAIGATCTHYNGPLAEGLMVGDTVRCPWHHACFSLRTGEALRAPALNPVPRWRVERKGDTVYVRDKLKRAKPAPLPMTAGMPKSVVILGGGAAGNAAAETLRNEGYSGRIAILSADESGPYDRPNLSKDYLAGNAAEDWIPLRSPDFYRDHDIDLKLRVRATALDLANRKVQLADGGSQAYDALLLATGAEPVRLTGPGADSPNVLYLRTLADSRAIVAKAQAAKRVVVIGASFIGLEVAASLRARKLEVHVVAPDDIPMARVMGLEIGKFVQSLHEKHGVKFHLGTTVESIKDGRVALKDGSALAADFVVAGIGVRPATALAEQAGLANDRGILVDEYLQTSVPGVFAAGDIARWPDRLTGDRIRVEHWVVAERQGQTAARNILGMRERFDAVPFFWSQHYDTAISYMGHAEQWDRIEIDGKPEAGDCEATFWRGGRKLAVVTISRDLDGLRAEAELETVAGS